MYSDISPTDKVKRWTVIKVRTYYDTEIGSLEASLICGVNQFLDVEQVRAVEKFKLDDS